MTHPKPSFKSYFQRTYAVQAFPPTWILFQPFGGIIAFLAQSLGLRPNGVTIIGGFLGLVACYQFATLPVTFMASFHLGLLFLVVYGFDCADGQLARGTQQTSPLGKWLDLTIDLFLIVLFPLCIGWLLQDDLNQIQVLIIILALAFGRASALFTSAIKRSGGEDHSPSSSLLKKIFQSLIDTPVFYGVLCFARLEPNFLYFSSVGYGVYFFIISLYFARTFRS